MHGDSSRLLKPVPHVINSPPFSLTKIEELTAGSDEKKKKNKTAQPRQDSNQGLLNASKTLLPPSYEATTGTVCDVLWLEPRHVRGLSH